MWNAPDYIRHIRLVPRVWETHVFKVTQLVTDIEDGRLPPVTYVSPQFWLSDHPDASICYGENWTTQIMNAVMRSDMWKDTAVFIAWDDWGGFYDHMPPPEDPDTGTPIGFRVPLLTISPYAKAGTIDSRQGDFGSIIRFIEANWKLKPLPTESPSDGKLMGNFDFSQAPLPPDPLPMRTDCQGYDEDAVTTGGG